MLVLRVLLLLIALLLPGWLATFSLTRSFSKAIILALPVSSGIAYSLGNYSHLLSIPLGTPWLLFEISALLVCSVFAIKRYRDVKVSISRYDVLLLTLGVVCAGVMLNDWHSAAGSFSQLLPNHDAMYHSYAIRNILNFNSNSVSDALTLFPSGAGTAANFYPLGLHSILGLGVDLSGLSINSAMNVATIGIGVCCFPLSISLWARTISPENKKLGLVAIPVSYLVATVFPLSPLSWGGMPAIVAMSIAPAVASVVVALIQSRTFSHRILISLTLVGLFSIHATELITVGLLVLVAVLLRGETHVLRKWIQSREPLIISILSGLMLLPVVLAASGGASERSLDYQPVLNLSNTIGQYLLFSFSGFELPIAAVLCICGLMVARKYKKQVLAWSFVSLGIVIGLAAQFPTNRVLTIFTKPWYGQVLRLDYNVVYFAIPLISLAVVHLVELLMPREHPRLLNTRKLTAAVILIALFIPAASQSHAASQKLQESWYNGLIPVNQNSVAAFHWMKQNMEDDQFVMTDVDGVDGSTWMYALANVRPIMYGAITSDQRDKWRSIKFELLKSVGRLQENASLLQWVVTHKVKYFYFDERTNAISPNHTVTLPTLQSDSKLREVFSRENAHVFEFIN